jgi:hypothetical protein
VFRGHECERVGDFAARLQLEFPEAVPLTYNTLPDDAVRRSGGQFTQVCCVKPIASSARRDLTGGDLVDPSKVSDKIKGFYDWNDVSRFQYDRPITKDGSGGGDNEFKVRIIEIVPLP